MPICGFDKGMLDGLEMFYQGLIKAVERKSKEKNITLESALGLEINEMYAFIGELDNLKNQNDKQALQGVTYLAQALYKGAAEMNSNCVLDTISNTLNTQKNHLRKLFYKTDEIYEKECRDEPNPMKSLVDRIKYIKR